MIDNLAIFNMAGGLIANATARQSVIAQNIANADTPGYRARDIASFSESYRSGSGNEPMRATRAGHLTGSAGPVAAPQSRETDDAVSPNGNSVSLETEMVKASEVRLQHDLALSVYSSSLNILRTSIGRR